MKPSLIKDPRFLQLQRYIIAGFIFETNENCKGEQWKELMTEDILWGYWSVYQYLLENGNKITPDLVNIVWADEYIDLNTIFDDTWFTRAWKYIWELIEFSFREKIKNWEDTFKALEDLQKKKEIFDRIITGFSQEWDLGKTLISVENEIENNMSGTGKFIKTGINTLDDAITWMYPWRVYRLVGYMNSGKSKLSYSIAVNAAKQWAKIAYFSLEVTAEEATVNMISNFYNIPFDDIFFGRKMVDFSKFSELKIKTYGNIKRLEDIERIVNSTRPDVVFIDYVQCVRIDSSFRMETKDRLDEYAQRIKQLAKSAKTAIFDLSQVPRWTSQYKKGEEIPAKGSSELEAAADVALVLVPDAEWGDEVKLHLAKNRWGKRFIEMSLLPDFSRAKFAEVF